MKSFGHTLLELIELRFKQPNLMGCFKFLKKTTKNWLSIDGGTISDQMALLTRFQVSLSEIKGLSSNLVSVHFSLTSQAKGAISQIIFRSSFGLDLKSD